MKFYGICMRKKKKILKKILLFAAARIFAGKTWPIRAKCERHIHTAVYMYLCFFKSRSPKLRMCVLREFANSYISAYCQLSKTFQQLTFIATLNIISHVTHVCMCIGICFAATCTLCDLQKYNKIKMRHFQVTIWKFKCELCC